MTTRDYDVVLYGAGGFTGRQTVAYFAQHAPADLRWAIAGRHRDRLEAARAERGGLRAPADVLIADSEDQVSVDAVVSRARVVLNTAGPFALYGTPVVDACVRFATHYVDITGETPWVHDMIVRYHQRAAAAGTRIIPCCGFDSVPSDLGTLLMARHVQLAFGVACVEVRGYFQLSGGLNGGTVASLMNLLQSDNASRRGGPFMLDPETPHRPRQTQRSRALKVPRFDLELGTWVGPFFMAPINTRIVRRSAALFEQWQEPYGPEFVYQEALKYDPPFAGAKAWAGTSAIVGFYGAVRQPLTRRLVAPWLPKPGSGPSAEKMASGWFTCDLLAIAEDGRHSRGVMAYAGDPGNRATTVLVCESALAVALEADRLPGGIARGGVLTPATGLGPVLADRLRRAGVTIDIGPPA
jgi:short subunit dehydrogenase-like uncharacterized protein